MQYDPETGHRIKESGANWMHKVLSNEKEIDSDFNLCQCLFGEHLLSKYPEKVVILVEAEKTAIIGSGMYPEYVWVAVGGKGFLKEEKLRILEGRTVFLIPDIDAHQQWSEDIKKFHFARFIVIDVLKDHASQEERERMIDIADWLVEILMASRQDGPPSLD